MKSPAPNQLPAWHALAAHHAKMAPLHLRDLFADEKDRFRRLSLHACDLFLDYSKNRVSGDTMALLVELARQTGVEDWRDRMFAGDAVNARERRAALHVALRHPGGTPFPDAHSDVMRSVEAARRQMREISEGVRSGSRLGYSGKPIESVVHIGIGGSHLGPEMASRALVDAPSRQPTVRFVSNVDASNLLGAVDGLDAETSLFIVASKTFTTPDTMANAASAVEWLLQRGAFPPRGRRQSFTACVAFRPTCNSSRWRAPASTSAVTVRSSVSPPARWCGVFLETMHSTVFSSSCTREARWCPVTFWCRCRGRRIIRPMTPRCSPTRSLSPRR